MPSGRFNSIEPLVERGERVDRALLLAGKIAEDVGHRAKVLVDHLLVLVGAGHPREVVERRRPARAVDAEGQALGKIRAIGGREADPHGHGLARHRRVEPRHLAALAGTGQGLHRVRGGNAEEPGLLAIDGDVHPWPRRLEGVVDIDDTRGGLEDPAHLTGQGLAGLRGGTVDLRDQRVEHRRSGGISITFTRAPRRFAISRSGGRTSLARS